MKLLTIDLEDWFHILSHEETAQPHQWEKFPSRVERNTNYILEQLSVHNQRATFFCLGWIAQKHPGLIKKISEEGHDIACHSMYHQLIYEQTRELFRKDLEESIKVLQNLTGKKVNTYRAPGFSLTEKTKWVFEVVAECGIENDCSVFPAKRNHGGYEDYKGSGPSLINVNGVYIKEFPMSTLRLAGLNIVFSGGGYFRLLPYTIIRGMIRRSTYIMTYFHPRDFDPGQPVLKSLPLRRKWMSYTGLSSSGKKFETLLRDFRFLTVEEASVAIDWSLASIVTIE